MKNILQGYLFLFLLSTFISCGPGNQNIRNNRPKKTTGTPTNNLLKSYINSVKNYDNAYALYYEGILIENHRKIPIKCFHQKNKAFIVSVFFEGKQIFPIYFYDKEGFKWIGDQYINLNESEKKTIKQILSSGWYFKGYDLYKKKYSFTIVEEHFLWNGQPVSIIKTLEKDITWIFYIEKQHGLIVKLEKKEHGEKIFEMEFMDFRIKNGMEIPHHWLIHMTNPPEDYKIIWKSIKINIENPFNQFSK